MSGWKILGAIVALAVTAVVAVGVLMYFRVIPIPGPILAFLVGAKEPEYSARFYPPDTVAYAWVDAGAGRRSDRRYAAHLVPAERVSRFSGILGGHQNRVLLRNRH